MAIVQYEALVDEAGNLVLPVADLKPGTRVRLSAILIDEDSGKEVLVESTGGRLRSWIIELEGDTCAEIRDVALGTMAFWDNPVDNEVWG